MKLILRLLFFSLLMPALYAQTITQKLDTFMTAAERAHEFNGVVLVARNDSILLAKGYGWRDFDQCIPHDINSVFLVGSITKTFTATAILYLQEQGKLSINDAVTKYFPGYQYGKTITIKNLLTHTSGIYNYTEDAAYHPEASFTSNMFWNIIKNTPLEFEPDATYGYSNSNYFLLGLIIEKITGKSYEKNIAEIIFEKAGMKHSGFDFTQLKSPYKSVGYDVDDNGNHVRSIIADSSGTFAAGSLYTTAGDLYLWYKALAAGLIINRQTFRQAVTAYRGAYGYGWQIDSAYGHPQWEHNGGTMGFAASFRNLPDINTCFIVLRNESVYPSTVSIGVFNILYGVPNYYIPRTAVAQNALELQQYIGKYKLDAPQVYEIAVSVRNGILHTKVTGNLETDYYKEKKDLYFLKEYDCQLLFTRNADGKVTGLTGYLGGQAYQYKKIE